MVIFQQSANPIWQSYLLEASVRGNHLWWMRFLDATCYFLSNMSVCEESCKKYKFLLEHTHLKHFADEVNIVRQNTTLQGSSNRLLGANNSENSKMVAEAIVKTEIINRANHRANHWALEKWQPPASESSERSRRGWNQRSPLCRWPQFPQVTGSHCSGSIFCVDVVAASGDSACCHPLEEVRLG